jgi:hypothetical protein
VGATFKVEAAAVVRTEEEEEEMEMEEAAVAGREGRGVALMSRHTHTSSEVTLLHTLLHILLITHLQRGGARR